jgi:proline iminopeptidase
MTEATVPDRAPDWIKDHVRRYLATDGEDGHKWTPPGGKRPFPTLLLTTTGRRTGQKFVMPLIYGRSGRDYVIVASKGGSPTHPGWYLNLVAHPEVEVQVGSDRFRAKARSAAGSERGTMWGQMAAIFPNYDEYQKVAGREIPVVVLEPDQH